jgi:hypothetical protein
VRHSRGPGGRSHASFAVATMQRAARIARQLSPVPVAEDDGPTYYTLEEAATMCAV